jgi:hypothetical protein
LSLALLLALSGCGGFPRPFEGNPGATARRLAQPPPVRLAVPPPSEALLDDAGAVTYADQIASDLATLEVPAVAGPAHKGDWVLRIDARLQGANVTPHFEVLNPAGKSLGEVTAPAVPASAWNTPGPTTLQQSAQAAAPGISGLLTQIQAVIARSDPNSLLNRPAHLYFAGVTGAPGDGNTSLGLQMHQALPNEGELVQDTPDGADFAVRGTVKVTNKLNSDEQTVEIQWIVNDARGERGRVVQLNDVPKGTLDGLWGDVALVVAQQGAAGVRGVIENTAGGKRTPAQTPPGQTAPPQAPSTKQHAAAP